MCHGHYLALCADRSAAWQPLHQWHAAGMLLAGEEAEVELQREREKQREIFFVIICLDQKDFTAVPCIGDYTNPKEIIRKFAFSKYLPNSSLGKFTQKYSPVKIKIKILAPIPIPVNYSVF